MTDTNRFGSDVILNEGDIIPNNNGDIFTSQDYEDNNPDTNLFSGYYSMIFSLTDRLMTIRGDNVYHSEYGSSVPMILSSSNSPDFKQKLEETVKRACLEDSRVKSISYVNIDQNDRFVNVKVGVVLEDNSKVFDLIFPNFLVD